MDKGPFRGQGQESKKMPVEQHSVNQPRLERAVESMPRTAGYSRQGFVEKPAKRSGKRGLTVVASVVILALLGLVGWLLWSSGQGTAAGVDSSKYQMVKLSDGQTYYGKLSSLDKDYMKLSDVFYLENEANSAVESEETATEEQDASQNKYKLLKFTGIYFGPEDEMTIAREQIINYVNLDPKGKIVEIINQYKASN